MGYSGPIRNRCQFSFKFNSSTPIIQSMKTVVVIPAYDAAGSLPDLLAKIRCEIENIVVIDDGSSDKTAVTAVDSGATVIRHSRNRGKGAALRTGFAYAVENGFDSVITIDSDGQHDPADIPRFGQAFIESHADMIIGSRVGDRGLMPWPRRFSNWSTSRFLSLILRRPIEDCQCGYRLISIKLLKSIALESDKFELESEMIIRAIRGGFNVEFIPIRGVYVKNAPSHMRPLADTLRWCSMVLKMLTIIALQRLGFRG